MKKFLFNYVLPYLLYGVVQLLCRTLREKNLNPEGENYFQDLPGKYILTLWHGRIFYLFYHYRSRPDYYLLVSPSADGDLLARLARLMGYSVIRGSTFKQAKAGARSLIKVLRNEGRIIVVADGSRGPRCQAQPGCIQLARATGAPVIPMTYDAERKIEFNSWDRFALPLPFSRCQLNFGKPIHVPREAGDDAVQTKRREMEDSLNRLTAEAGKFS
ncbi:MAG: lysophospholipid acyltransferase family protein [Nitrospinae bacterium]|nr:lysophospholipid acyltransferase family protein [Nitrospinota bacterium]